jgi:hypothetical protein
MSYGAAGYEDDWDDDEFDFGDHSDPDYSAENVRPPSKYTENRTSVKTNDVPKTTTFKNAKFGGGFGSPTDSILKSTGKSYAGRGRGKSWGVASNKGQNNFQSKNDVSSTKNKGQGNFLFARTKGKT